MVAMDTSSVKMADSYDDVPPLEDMSETLKAFSQLKVKQTYPDTPTVTDTGCGDAKSDEATQTGCYLQKASTFGGLKKGFFCDVRPKTKPDNTKLITLATKEKKKKDDLCIDEVQEAMREHSKLPSNDWISEDLLQKICKNKKLSSQLLDPKFMAGLNEFVANPAAAYKKYTSDPDVLTFFKDLCEILGDHFTKLGEKQVKEKVMDYQSKSDQPLKDVLEEQANTLLSNPEIKEALLDPKVQTLIHAMKKGDQGLCNRILTTSSSATRAKIQKLIDEGLLEVSQ